MAFLKQLSVLFRALGLGKSYLSLLFWEQGKRQRYPLSQKRIRKGLIVLVLGHRIKTLFFPVPRFVFFKSQLTHKKEGNSKKCFTKASSKFEHAQSLLKRKSFNLLKSRLHQFNQSLSLNCRVGRSLLIKERVPRRRTTCLSSLTCSIQSVYLQLLYQALAKTV